MARMGHFSKRDLDARQNSAWFSWGQPGLAQDTQLPGLFRRSPTSECLSELSAASPALGLSFEAARTAFFQTFSPIRVRRSWIVPIADRNLFLEFVEHPQQCSLRSLRTYLVQYTHMIEVSILAFMVSGAFLGFVYLDVIYQMIGITVV